MKKLLTVLVAGVMVLMFSACSNDEDSDLYEKSAENACEYLIQNGGTNIFEMNFYYEEATKDELKVAKDLCIRKIKGMPYCSNEYIDVFSCSYAEEVKNVDLMTKELTDALNECSEKYSSCNMDVDHESSDCRKLMDCELSAYGTMHPCGIADIAREECLRASEDVENAIHDYIASYRDQYSPKSY